MRTLIEESCNLWLADASYPVCGRVEELMNAAMWEVCGGGGIGDACRLFENAVLAHYKEYLGDFDGRVSLTDGSTGVSYALFRLLGRRVRAYRGLVSRFSDAFVDTDGVARPLALSSLTGYSATRELEAADVALIYLCSPSAVTGEAVPRKVLEAWVRLAEERRCLLVLDSTLSPFILEDEHANRFARSIFEVVGAHKMCAELFSFAPRWYAGLDVGGLVTPSRETFMHRLETVEGRMRYARAKRSRVRGVFSYAQTEYVLMRAAVGVLEAEARYEIKNACRGYIERIRAVASFVAARGLDCGVCAASPFLLVKGRQKLCAMGIRGRDAGTLSGAFCGFSVLSGF